MFDKKDDEGELASRSLLALSLVCAEKGANKTGFRLSEDINKTN